MEEGGGPRVVNSMQESSVKWCSVNLSDIISRGKRLEASVFDVEAKQARQIIHTCKYPTTFIGGESGLTTSYTGARFKRVWLKKSEYPIFQPSSITDIKPSPDGYISHLTKTNIDKLRVKKGQVLMTCSGTIGKVSYVSSTLDRKIFSHDLLRIDCRTPSDAGYIYAYLKSKIGNKILLTNSYGAVITHIESEHLATVPVPDAPVEIKGKISNLIVRSYELRDESNSLIDEATALLVEALMLPPIERFNINMANAVESFSIKLSDLNYRADASYHLPIVDKIIEHLSEHAEELSMVGDPRISKDVILPGRFKRIYVDEGFGTVLFGGKQMHELDPSGKKYLSTARHDKRIINQLQISENTILISRSGTIGKVTLVPKHWGNWVASEHIIRIIPASNEIAGYISIFLSSDYGYQLITHYTYGSVVDEIDDSHVKEIPIPLLKDKEVQKKINDLALLANQKRYEAYCLEQEALKILDEEVIFIAK